MRIALVPGDGIGPEVIAEVRLLAEALAGAGALDATLDEFDWGADRYLATGVAVPDGAYEVLRSYDAIMLGALGDPRVPGHEHAREIVLGTRARLDLFVNLRPVRCLSARLCPLRDVEHDRIDLVIVRENTEGMYAGAGGVVHAGSVGEVAVQEMVATRHGVERIVRFAFETAQRRPRQSVTLVDKSNALSYVGSLWRRVFAAVAEEYPGVATDHLYVDAAAMWMVKDPSRFDVMVTENMFGDILSDIGAALAGGLGMAPSANLNPAGVSMFEPVHGSAPDIAGRGVANPMAALASFGLLLSAVGRADLAAAVDAAIAATVERGVLTRDVGGSRDTNEVGSAVREAVFEQVVR